MKNTQIILLLLFLLGIYPAQAQQNTTHEDYTWLTIDSGHAIYLDTGTMNWVPLADREKVHPKSYLLIHPGASVTLYYQTNAYPLPAASYLFLEDVLRKDRSQIVKMLTQIEAEQLPIPDDTEEKEVGKIGITYGNTVSSDPPESASIPYYEERLRAIDWFLDQQQEEVSLLMLKRLMAQYPALYKNVEQFNLLCSLHEKLGFWGFLHNETQKLMQMDTSEEMTLLARNWQQRARGSMRNN